MKSFLVGVVASVVVAACVPPTSFKGEAKVPDGVAGCRHQCEADGLAFGGFVYSGEFATSCVCSPRPDAAAPSASASESSASAGVIVQTQAAAAAAAANNSNRLMMQQQQQQRSHAF